VLQFSVDAYFFWNGSEGPRAGKEELSLDKSEGWMRSPIWNADCSIPKARASTGAPALNPPHPGGN